MYATSQVAQGKQLTTTCPLARGNQEGDPQERHVRGSPSCLGAVLSHVLAPSVSLSP